MMNTSDENLNKAAHAKHSSDKHAEDNEEMTSIQSGSTLDWLDDAFDDKKTKETLEAAHSNKTGCLIVVVIAIVIIALSLMSIGFFEAVEGL